MILNTSNYHAGIVLKTKKNKKSGTTKSILYKKRLDNEIQSFPMSMRVIFILKNSHLQHFPLSQILPIPFSRIYPTTRSNRCND